MASKAIDRTLAFATLAILTVALAVFFWSPSATSPPTAQSPRPAEGVDTIAVILLSSVCPACQKEPEAGAVKRLLRESLQRGVRPYMVAIAMDEDPIEGIRFLASYGSFDELSAGGGWLNSVVVQRVWGDSLTLGALPQIITVERSIAIDEAGRMHVVDIPTGRYLGLTEMASWLERLSPVEF